MSEEIKRYWLRLEDIGGHESMVRASDMDRMIAKRDARIVELEHRCGVYGLELHNATERLQQAERQIKAIKAQEPVAWAATARKKGITDQRSFWHGEAAADEWISHYIGRGCDVTKTPLYAAPVSEAKAQGVAVPAELDRAFITGESCDGVYRVVIQSEKLKEMQAVHSWLTRLNAAPVQQVSVPDGWKWVPVEPTPEMLAATTASKHEGLRAEVMRMAAEDYHAMLNAAPAAPAADAGVTDHE